MQQQGFDYAYDKRLYDRLRDRQARPVREHLFAEPEFQDKLARFLENHDEPRAAATFSTDVHRAAAVITYLSPGLRFFHQGQFEGRQKRISPHLGRGPDEPNDQQIHQFYERLLNIMRRPTVRDGKWELLECASAWDGNWTHDCFLAFAWQGAERLIAAVNYALQSKPMQCPFAVRGSWRKTVAASGSTFACGLPVERRRPAAKRPVPGYGAVASASLRTVVIFQTPKVLLQWLLHYVA